MAIYPDKLIILDYSGTLSPEAPLFAGPDSLLNELAVSGLQDFGIDSPHVFWEKLVNPTWQEGSTTSAGYKKVLSDRIIAALHPDMSMPRRAALARAVSTFVDHYLGRSRIDPLWKPVLHKISGASSVMTVIATDHYAEATGAIIRFLGKWKITATAAMDIASPSHPPSFIVANSADIGFHKSDPRFWQALKTGLRLHALHDILMIDDFGCNEQEADDYRKRHQVKERMKTTLTTLETVFSAAIEVFPFMIETDIRERRVRLENLFEEMTGVIDRFLTSGQRAAKRSKQKQMEVNIS